MRRGAARWPEGRWRRFSGALQVAWFVLLTACGGLEAAANTAADGVSLPATLPSFGPVRIVVQEDLNASPPSAALVLENPAGKVVYRFPPLAGTDEYAYFSTDALGLHDVDGDGRQDVLAIISMVTGIGPTGAEPFPVAAIYLQRDGAFEAAKTLEERVNDPPVYGTWHDMRSLTKALARIPHGTRNKP